MRIAVIAMKDLSASAERQIVLLQRALATPDDEVSIFVRNPRVLGPYPLPPNIQTRELPVASAGELIYRKSRGLFDVVHAYSPRTLSLLNALHLARGGPLVIHHEDDEAGLSRSVWPRLLRPAAPVLSSLVGIARPDWWPYETPALRWLVRRRRRVWHEALTPVLAGEVMRIWGRPCISIASSTDLQLFTPARAPESALMTRVRGRFVAMYAGYLWRAVLPDIRIMLNAIRLAVERGSRVVLVLLGGARRGFDVLQLVRDAGMEDHVLLVGEEEDYRRVPGKLACADVLLQPGAPSSFNRLRLPSKLNDYFAMGKPVITFSVGFGEQLRDGQEALLTYSDSPEELAIAILRLERDPGLRVELGRNARRFAEQSFDATSNGARLRELYEEAVRD